MRFSILYLLLFIPLLAFGEIKLNSALLKEKIAEYAEPSSWVCQKMDREVMPCGSFCKETKLSEILSDVLLNVQHNLGYFKVEKGKIYYYIHPLVATQEHLNRMAIIYQVLETLIKETGLFDVSFLISLGDLAHTDLPVLGFSKHQSDACFLIPDFEILRGHKKLDEEVFQGSERYTWREKKEELFWRGSSTGGHLESSTFLDNPRVQLVLLSLKYPELLNARFYQIVQASDTMKTCFENLGFIGQGLSPKDSCSYKYLIDVDGNGSSFSRGYWILKSGSVLFKQESDLVMWYFDLLKPYVHYIPFKLKYEDLSAKKAWAQSHNEEAYKITLAAKKVADAHLSQEAAIAYFYTLIQRISRCQKS